LPGFFMPKKKKFSKLFLSLQFIRKSRKDMHKNKIFFIFVLLTLFFSALPALAQKSKKDKSDFPVLKGPYLGQKPPGIKPEIFAAGLILNP